jgi:hypothetical protein
MRTTVKLTFALVLLAVTHVEIFARQNSNLVGSYVFSFEWGGGEITLNKKGRFTATSSSCTSVTTESGNYSVSNNLIRFTTLKLSIRNFDDHKEHDLTKRKARKKYLETDEPFKPESWEVQVVRWGERVYLVDQNAYRGFIEAINLGFEPRQAKAILPYFGSIYLRIGDENKPVAGPPPFPEEFLRDLLPAPVIATIIELKTEGTSTLATIDRGSADGLREKMPLVSVTPTIFFRGYRIRSVREHTAEVDVYGDVKVGDQLSTRVANVWR